MRILITTLLVALPLFASAKEVIVDAPANKATQFKMKETYDVAGIFGSVTIKKHEETQNPTRIVIGLYEGSPKSHSFQVVLERIKNSEEYWLAYEYVYQSKPQIRIDIQSGIKLNQKVPFNFFWHKGGRLQIATFETAHFPYTNMKSKTPFFRASSGEAVVNYEYREAYWKENAPPESN